eukprot:1092970-Alexandrium_andersonii.AAC.1
MAAVQVGGARIRVPQVVQEGEAEKVFSIVPDWHSLDFRTRLALKRTHQRARRANKKNRCGRSTKGTIDQSGEPTETEAATPDPDSRGGDPPR